eukprot:gene9541-11696_t
MVVLVCLKPFCVVHSRTRWVMISSENSETCPHFSQMAKAIMP